MAEAIAEKAERSGFKEAVCINTGRIYDSCCDKDCLQDMQVYFPGSAQAIIDNAVSVRGEKIEVIDVYIDVEPLPFNRGYYTVDMTFFFRVEVSAYTSPFAIPVNVSGVAAFTKRSVLYGSEGNAKVFTSNAASTVGSVNGNNMPRATVQASDRKQAGVAGT